MNKVVLMGRLTKDPETRYSKGDTSMAVTRTGIAINRRFRRNGEAEADFFNIVAFGKTAEFLEKYFKKGQMISIVGRLQNNNWEDQSGQKRYSTEVIVEETYFAESKTSFENRRSQGGDDFPPDDSYQNQPNDNQNSPNSDFSNQGNSGGGFDSMSNDLDDEDLPF